LQGYVVKTYGHCPTSFISLEVSRFQVEGNLYALTPQAAMRPNAPDFIISL
jgi:hypothetical protein